MTVSDSSRTNQGPADTAAPAPSQPAPAGAPSGAGPVEVGGRGGLDPTRYGDWEKNGRCIDF
jgi:hypothetical protein